MRESGILLHITSLPSRFGIGDLGPGAYRFADFLRRAGQRLWQVLPLCPTDPIHGNSPYNSTSAFAGNVLLISPESMVREGFLRSADLKGAPAFPEGKTDYPAVSRFKQRLFNRAFERFGKSGRKHEEDFAAFCDGNSRWLDDYALFVVLKGRHRGRAWNEWPRRLRDREQEALREAKAAFKGEMEREKFLQFIFDRQWRNLKRYMNHAGIQVIGDLPIYVHQDSADVWCNPGCFMLDRNKRPAFVAGVPPDYFSRTGQLWGNPLYRWDVLKRGRYRWWIHRLAHNLERFDMVRIDHFRGFVAFWRVPAGSRTAVHGRWVKAPAEDFFRTLLKRIPGQKLIAEDLGFITPDVTRVLEETGIPGMRVLLFAFEEGMERSPHAPHNHVKNCVVYTGTHDNNTVRGWFENDAGIDEKMRLFRYLGHTVKPEDVHREFIRMAMTSPADRAVIPMQDVLGLGEEARMNRPSIRTGNWQWRLKRGQTGRGIALYLKKLTSRCGRKG